MVFLTRKRGWLVKLPLVVLLAVALYSEFVVYLIYSFRWPGVSCGETKDYQKVLLVADPQILGEKTEPWIARWDSDRYLSKTFWLAVNHLEPEIIVFLGDLMDEGSICDDEQHDRYYDRFKSNFVLDYFASNQTIYLPGDNDIGGEDEEITSYKVNRYESHFGQPDVFEIGHIQYIKINKLLNNIPSVDTNDARTLIRVVFTHIPLLGLPSYFASQAVTQTKPHVIFSAHDHKSVHFVGDLSTGERVMVEELELNEYGGGESSWRFQTDAKLTNEIIVPTCSYRMGVEEMGYGMALIDKRGESVCYSVLWLPPRLTYLRLYLYVLGLSTVYYILLFLCRCLPCPRSSAASKIPASKYHQV